MLEEDILRLPPLALLRQYFAFVQAADGSLPFHWTLARAFCAIAERELLARSAPIDPPLAQAELAAGVDELGRLLMRLAPFRDEAALLKAWPQVQAYLLLVLPPVEQLLLARAQRSGQA